MNEHDARLLSEMRTLIRTAGDPPSLYSVVNKLLTMRDRLSFDDYSWFEEFTSNVVTLDSGASFVSRDELESQVANAAIDSARQRLLELIEAKIKGAVE